MGGEMRPGDVQHMGEECPFNKHQAAQSCHAILHGTGIAHYLRFPVAIMEQH
jgi:hypothetical protein